jgi:predicted nucleic acid-binding protein
LIPPGVADELSDVFAPPEIRAWIRNHPFWLGIHRVRSTPDSERMAALDRGEHEAIQLAVESNAEVLVMDEWEGRAMAQRRSFPVTGTLPCPGQCLSASVD